MMTAQRAHTLISDLPVLNLTNARFHVDIGHSDPETVVVQLIGEIDLSTQSMLVAALEHVLEGWPQRVIIGLAHVDFFGARGVSVLCAAHRDAVERGASFVLTAPPPPVTRVLAITGVGQIMPVYPTMAHALGNV